MMQSGLSTSPNGAIPAALLRKPALDSAQLADVKGHAAGILFVAPDGDVLLLRRSSTEPNYGGHWALPGGKMDDGESPEQGADRETVEEIGFKPVGDKKLLDQCVTPNKMVFHTFAQPSMTKFTPTLNDEHSGYAWAPLNQLPRPLHPSVEQTIKDRIGATDGMTPEDFAGARDGFVKWSETKDEDEEFGATDSVFEIAMDRDSVREKTRDGRLVVKKTNISKANVCPYRGKEIPKWQDLGLDPDRIYNLLRDPEELEKAAPTLNGVQLLIKHIPVNAQDHRPNETVGSLGTDAEFDGEYLTNSLFVNAQHAIDAIETGQQRELSAGYHYKADMTPGIFRGTAYDGVMRDIVFNHVALVEDGRAGPDVVVGDEALKENDMAKATRFGAMTLSITASAIAPLLAMDSRVKLPKDLFAPLTTKNFKEGRTKLLGGVRAAIDGKLRTGLALDASMEGLAKAIDAFTDDLTAGIDEPAPEDKQGDLDKVAAVEPPKPITEPGSTYDAEPFKSFLREKGMGEDDIMKACDMMPKPALDSEESDEDKAKREAKEKADKEAAAAKDAEMKDNVSKPAMDAALKAQAAEFDKQIKAVRENERGVRAAIAEVHPWTGDLPASMAFDSAADVHRHALEMLNVDGAKTLHADALLPILKSIPKPGARAPANQSHAAIAMDSSAVSKAVKIAPGLEHISTAL